MEKYLDFRKEKDYKKLQEPAKIIKTGGIVIFPTETVYGIGTNGFNEEAIKKLYIIKKRPLNKPISLLVNNIEMVETLAENITPLEYKLMKEFFPGPFTIVLKKKNIVPDILTAGKNTVGVRMPSNNIAKKLIEYVGVPVATPSANISGKPSGTDLADILPDFNGKVDYVINDGKSEIGLASTIVQVVNGVPKILRIGAITEKQIAEACNKV